MTPEHILQVGLGFWGSKTLLSAVELGVFAELAAGPQEGMALANRLGLHPRGVRDFLDALVALGLLERNGRYYANTPETATFLDPAKPGAYVGGLLHMANARLYPFWGSLTEALRTGQPQNESKTGGNAFEKLYSTPESLRSFLGAMTGISSGIARAIGEKFPWVNYRTFIDIGTAQGGTPVQIALKQTHLTGGGFDLPVVGPVFEEYVTAAGLANRLRFYPGSFFTDPLPSGRRADHGPHSARLEHGRKTHAAGQGL